MTAYFLLNHLESSLLWDYKARIGPSLLAHINSKRWPPPPPSQSKTRLQMDMAGVTLLVSRFIELGARDVWLECHFSERADASLILLDHFASRALKPPPEFLPHPIGQLWIFA